VELGALLCCKVLCLLELCLLRKREVVNLCEVVNGNVLEYLVDNDLVFFKVDRLADVCECTLQLCFCGYIVAIVKSYSWSLLRKDWNLAKSDASETFIINQS
jgi:hypothetical protein